MTLVVSEGRSDFICWNVCCSRKCKSIATLEAAKVGCKLFIIVLDTLVISEKSRARVIVACRVVCVAKEVEHFSRHFFNPFNLVFSVHSCVPAEVIFRIGFELVSCSLLITLGAVINNSLFNYCSLNRWDLEKEAEKFHEHRLRI